jgi:hypothetical protein
MSSVTLPATRSVKMQPVKYLRPDRPPCFQAQTPVARRKFLRVRTRPICSLQHGCHNAPYPAPPEYRVQRCKRNIEMTPLCKLEMTLSGGFVGGRWFG